MALIKCPQCGNDCSENAHSCPKCGEPFVQNSINTGMNVAGHVAGKAGQVAGRAGRIIGQFVVPLVIGIFLIVSGGISCLVGLVAVVIGLIVYGFINVGVGVFLICLARRNKDRIDEETSDN